MDKTLKLRLKDFNKALLTLEEAIKTRKNKFVRDASIKRFEYCFELAWKTAKLFLLDNFGVEASSPKECFRQLGKNKLVSDSEVEKFLEMADDRNEIIHTYNDKFAEELYRRIVVRHFILLRKVYYLIEKGGMV
ncbi:MAG: HI0074 family nucleotidyltransferase substrate-binding subunit [Patescibacteria group bacterium]|nr:HI0074 family nucleotidyltransferase substrate-binding subunit [Patescibacteria group bacterium]